MIAYSKINDSKYKNITCSISGGADSDVVLDICERVNIDKKINYIWFDTGLEYQATKDHLKYLENHYGIKINTYKAIKSIPYCCKNYGQPFLSKRTSENIMRLQKHNFKWENKSFSELYKEYPKCKAALKWWCNEWGEESQFNIKYNRYLKEFMMQNPPWFKISPKCCYYAKKLVGKRTQEAMCSDLNIIGVRKAEKGARKTAYKNCFSSKLDSADEYRPVFFYRDADRLQYELHYAVIHSDCYTKYGLKRTGCAGCPYSKDFEYELKVIEEHEPKLFKAVNNIFGDSYEYTRQYLDFVKSRKEMITSEN